MPDEVRIDVFDEIAHAFEDPRGEKPVPDIGVEGGGALSEVQCQGRDDAFPTTEAGDSEYFAHLMRGRLRYDHSRRRWFRFGPHQWHLDSTTQVMQAALKVMRCRQQQALTIADSNERKQRMEWALRGESEARLKHLLDLAATHPVLAVDGTDWDANPWVLGVQNGLVDLQTGTVRPGRPEDRVTKVAAVPYDSAATCPRWCGFVREVCNDDEDLAAFLQRSIGYALTGETGEQCFFILFGVGANGKSTFLETLTRHVIPEHSWTMAFPVHSWTESLSEYQRAELVGRRLVVAKESEQAKRLNTEFVKSLTGGDTVNARHPYGRPFTFVPSAKFFFACNHRPIIRDTTHGMWRRVRLVDFTRTFESDDGLAATLAAEAPGILAWAVRGVLAWREDGLQPPANVLAATIDYQRESDTFLQFVGERCVVADYARTTAQQIWEAYEGFCADERIRDDERLGRKAFRERMRSDYETIDGQRVTYVGIGIQEAPDETYG